MTLAASIVAVGGCQTYHAQPLTPERVGAAAASDPLPELAVRAQSFATKWPKPAAPLIDPSGKVDPAGAALLAVVANPSLRAARAQKGVADAQLLQAGILPNPSLSANIDPVAFGSTSDTVTGWGVGINWEITSLLTRSASIDAARAAATSVDLSIAWQEWQVAIAARQHAYRVLWLTQQVELARAAETSAREFAQRASELQASRMMSAPDQEATLAVVDQAVSVRVDLESTLAEEQAALLKAIGLPQQATLVVVPPPSREGSDGAAPWTEPTPEAMSSALDTRADLAALRMGYASQESKLRAAVASQFPKVSVGLNPAQDTSNVGTIGIGISIDLPIFDRGQGRIAVESATREQLFQEYSARVFEATSDAQSAVAELKRIGARIAAAEAVAVRLEAIASRAQAGFAKGLVTSATLVQTRRDASDARMNVLKLRQQRDELRVAAEAVIGRWIEGDIA